MEKLLPLNSFILSEAQEITDEMGETGEKSDQRSSESEMKSPVIAKKYRKLCNRSELDEFKFLYSHFIKLLISIISFAFCFAGINLNYKKYTKLIFLYQLKTTLHCSFNKQAQTALFDSVKPNNPSDQSRLG